MADTFTYDATTGLPTSSAVKFINGQYDRSRPMDPNTHLLSDYVLSKAVEPTVSSWGQFAKGKLTGLKAQVNVTNLLEPSQRKTSQVKFLRSGKQWAVIVG